MRNKPSVMTRRQERKLARRLNHQPKPNDKVMVPADQPPVLTHGERGDVQFAARACRGIESAFNSAARAGLTKLSTLKSRIVPQLVLLCEYVTTHANAQADVEAVDREIKARGEHMHHQRRISRRVRILLLVVLGLLDVLAYRSAVEVVFGTSDDLAGRIESLMLAMLSIGMIVMAAASGDRIRHWLDAKADEEARDNDPLPVRAPRRELTLGMVFACLTVLALWAGARLRLRSMEIDGNPVSAVIGVATMVFSALAALGAFVIELRWASELLDKRDRLVEGEKKSRQRMDQQHNICARLLANYQGGLTNASTMWDEYQPLWSSQIHACLERVHHARKRQPSIFHPLSASIDELVKKLIEADTSVLDPIAEITRLGLRTEDIKHAVDAEMQTRRDTRTGAPPMNANTAVGPTAHGPDIFSSANTTIDNAAEVPAADGRADFDTASSRAHDDAPTSNTPAAPIKNGGATVEAKTAALLAPTGLTSQTNTIATLNGQPVDSAT
ncbi:MAG: hypothetical protein JWR83_230 [Aeromicrobium sp.]|nr:hypothetical protein [Aeromicrobium sp.]